MTISNFSHRERDEHYPHVIYQFEKWRVILCRDHIQWIIQRAEKRHGQREWTGKTYHRTSKSLCRVWPHLSGDLVGAEHLRHALPQRFQLTLQAAS